MLETNVLYLYVSATDRGGQVSMRHAEVEISIFDSVENLPQFTQDLYSFVTSEGTGVGTVIGNVSASATSGKIRIGYILIMCTRSHMLEIVCMYASGELPNWLCRVLYGRDIDKL